MHDLIEQASDLDDKQHVTWWIIPVSKWRGSPPFISHLGHLEGEQPYLGDLQIMHLQVLG